MPHASLLITKARTKRKQTMPYTGWLYFFLESNSWYHPRVRFAPIDRHCVHFMKACLRTIVKSILC